jgi:hypothetical protein
MIKPWSVGPYYPCQVGKLMMAVLLNSIHIFPFQPFDFALSYLDVHYLHRTVSPLIRDTLLSFIHPTLYFNPPLLTCFHHHLPLLFRPCPSTNLYTTATPPARDCNLLETQRHIDIHLPGFHHSIRALYEPLDLGTPQYYRGWWRKCYDVPAFQEYFEPAEETTSEWSLGITEDQVSGLESC